MFRSFVAALTLWAASNAVLAAAHPQPDRPDDRSHQQPGRPLDDSIKAALEALGRTELRNPGSLPNPKLKAGTDTLPGIEHIVLLMMENHSFDNIFGLL